MPPRVVALSGDLGSGKTTLARAILGGFGVTAAVTSPTFALVNRYSTGNGTATHVDLYRLHKLEELDEIGLLEMLQSDAMTIIEWPEIARQLLPEGTLFLRLEHVPGRADVRRVGVTR
jgi:tRNA threonylcarbamoyladenosine biosynthesis protein TsaE